MTTRKTADCRQIDVREMKRQGILEPGELFRWHWPEFANAVNMVVTEGEITVSYRDKTAAGGFGVVEYQIPIVRTDCHINGSRPWFGCPECGRRAAILYSISAGKFACRKCRRLAYPSQSEAVGDRAHRAANNIRRRLGWKVGIAHPEGDKPKWMRQATFDKLRVRYAKFAHTAWMDTARSFRMIPR